MPARQGGAIVQVGLDRLLMLSARKLVRGSVVALRLAMPLAGGACLPAAAQADVMEIDGAGWHWVAGGAHQVPVGRTDEAVPPAVPEAWRGLVATLAARYDLSPAMIEAVIWQESRWHANAISPAGARGLAQLMPATARALGTDPDDPAANIEGGVRYLRQLVDGFGGDIERALAAYNAGPGRVMRAGGVPAIPETRAYVTSIFQRLAASAGK
jgi:hypothetical protein